MIPRYFAVIVLFIMSLSVIPLYGQQFPYQPFDDNAKGVCTINGRVYYGIDCWCYSSDVGTTAVTIAIVVLLVFFFISGCIWACLFACCKCMTGRNDDDEGLGMASLRSSIRTPKMRRRDADI